MIFSPRSVHGIGSVHVGDSIRYPTVARVRIRLPITVCDETGAAGAEFQSVPLERRWVESGCELSNAKYVASRRGDARLAKYGCCSALRWQKPGPFFLVQVLWHRYCGTYNSPTDNTHLVHAMLSSRLPGEMKKRFPPPVRLHAHV